MYNLFRDVYICSITQQFLHLYYQFFKSLPLYPIPSHFNPVRFLTAYFNIHFNIIHFLIGLFSSEYQNNSLLSYIILYTHVICTAQIILNMLTTLQNTNGKSNTVLTLIMPPRMPTLSSTEVGRTQRKILGAFSFVMVHTGYTYTEKISRYIFFLFSCLSFGRQILGKHKFFNFFYAVYFSISSYFFLVSIK